jgi:phosphoglucosamine mutase
MSERKLFGTDGVRGVANAKLTPETALALGLAAGRHLVESGGPRRAVIGRDTRRSGEMLEAALAAGLCSAGIDAVFLGVAPTPTVSFAARTGDYGLGVIVSASHNPAPDNGIKFVGHDGRKLPDDVEVRLEALMEPSEARPVGAGIGAFGSAEGEIEAYLESLATIVPEGLDGMRVAVDAAHGAAYRLGPEILRRLGATVVETGVAPDGLNINAEGGATKPDAVGRLVRDADAHVGVAFDGDADRAVFTDERGRLINGDRTLGVWAEHQKRHGRLEPPVVVGTVMSNGGFERYLTENEIRLERTPVGDKYVAQRIVETGARVGGEQSGHLIFPERGPTGDGLVTMLEFLRVLKLDGGSASRFVEAYEPWPQLLVNLTVDRMNGWRENAAVADALAEGEKALEGRGRLVVRPSGTQPMIRVMAEAETYELRDQVVERIVEAMTRSLGGSVYGRVDLTHALGD